MHTPLIPALGMQSKGSLVYTGNSRTDRAIERDPVSKERKAVLHS